MVSMDLSSFNSLMWAGILNVYANVSVTDPITKIEKQEQQLVLENKPCHLSFAGSIETSDKGNYFETVGKAILFLSNEFVVPPGAKIEVAQDGRTYIYENAGVPAVYSTHQQIKLDLASEVV